jgi:hypothetical protein
MIGNERWLSHMKALVIVGFDLDISAARAVGRLFEACESGRVRSRCRKGSGPGKDIPSDWWGHAEIGGYEIRFPDGTVTTYDDIEISETDLSCWVDEQRAPISSSAAVFKQASEALLHQGFDTTWTHLGHKPDSFAERKLWNIGPVATGLTPP